MTMSFQFEDCTKYDNLVMWTISYTCVYSTQIVCISYYNRYILSHMHWTIQTNIGKL